MPFRQPLPIRHQEPTDLVSLAVKGHEASAVAAERLWYEQVSVQKDHAVNQRMQGANMDGGTGSSAVSSIHKKNPKIQSKVLQRC